MLLRLLGERFAYAEAYADSFPLTNEDLTNKSGAAPISRLVGKTFAYARLTQPCFLRKSKDLISHGSLVSGLMAYAVQISY